MAGIHTEDDAVTDGEEDAELHFHIELGETPPASPTVATFEAHIFDTYNNLESSLPAESHALSELCESSDEPEPRSSNHKVMAAQAVEALNRTFIELKSKNEDIRLRASYDLRDLVVSAARSKPICAPRLILCLC